VANRQPEGPEKEWVPARLIPSGKMSQAEQEWRATSVLLAVMQIVPAFTRRVLADFDAPGGKQIATYTEVRLKDKQGKVHIPDGAICITRGKRRWRCLVEVKTGRAEIETEQVERYLELARLHNFDAVLTISNQLRSDPRELPYSVNKVKVGKLQLIHVSWWRILTEAVIADRFDAVEDTEQAWVLKELIRYLDDPRSGASGLEDMSGAWVDVRKGARNQTLRASDEGVISVARQWHQFTEYLALHLSQELGVSVRNQLPRAKGPEERVKTIARQLADAGTMTGSFRVPNAVGAVAIIANLRERRVITSVEVPAPKDVKRPRAKVNWLLRQLREAPDDLRIEARFANVRRTASALLEDCRGHPDRLLLEDDPRREPRAFTVELARTMGLKNGLGQGTFIGETRKQAAHFYRDVVQNLSLPRPKAPRLREEEEIEPAPESDEAPGRTSSEEPAERDVGRDGNGGVPRPGPEPQTDETQGDTSPFEQSFNPFWPPRPGNAD